MNVDDINSIPGVAITLASINDPTLKNTATKAAQVALIQTKAFVSSQFSLIDKLAPLRSKIEAGTATPQETAEYNKMKEELAKISTFLDATSHASADEVRQLKEEALEKKLEALKGAQGHLIYSKANDLFEYVIRTQALNPYSRERTCDLELLEVIYATANHVTEEIEKLKELKSLIQEAMSS